MQKKCVLIFGGNGMLGNEFRETQDQFFDIVSLTHKECDISSFPHVLNQISLYNPDVILNFASYTDVEGAENRGMKEAFIVNTLAAQNMAKAASAFGVGLIHISTDYVFDGGSSSGYYPDATPNPINVYGMSKYLGEELMCKEYSDAIIVRSSALYGGALFGENLSKRNFINSLLQRSFDNTKISVVGDSYTIPTSCFDLSCALKDVVEGYEEYEGQILQLVSECDEGGVTWYDYALEVQKYLPDLPSIVPIASREYQSKVQRPKYSILKNPSSINLPYWKDSLKEYFSR